MYLADSLHWQTRLLSSCRADLVIVSSGLLWDNLGGNFSSALRERERERELSELTWMQ